MENCGFRLRILPVVSVVSKDPFFLSFMVYFPYMKRKIFDHITIDPKVRFGRPVIEGTRIPVELIVGKIAGGMTIPDVMNDYDLTQEQIRAALQYAAKLVAEEEVAFA